MGVSILSLLAVGFVLGLKHALDADHLAAVSTMATERRSLVASSLIGAMWGLGHTASLLLAGCLVLIFQFEINASAARVLEFGVGLMLVALGINTLRKLRRGARIHMHAHEHGGFWHAHPHLHQQKIEDRPHMHHGLKSSARPLLVGMVHGMAGIAALMLLVLATTPSRLAGFLYIALFGIGSIGGMMIMSTLFALPARLTSMRFAHANLTLRGLAGAFSLAFGIFTIYKVGFLSNWNM